MGDQVNQNLQQVAEHGKDIFQHIHTTRGKHVLPLAPLETLVAQHEERLRSPSPDPGSLEEYINNTHFVFQRSPPCYKPLSSLKKADITNLKWSTVHRGRFVVLRTSTHPRLLSTNLGQLETIVEDERGVGVTLRVFNVNVDVRASNAEKWLPMGSVIAILEPYCEPIPDMDDAKRKKSSTSSGIRVDHPSDIVSLERLDKLYPKQWASDTSTPTISGEQSCEVLKEEGNQAFKAKDYYVAIQRYVLFIPFSFIQTPILSKIHVRSPSTKFRTACTKCRPPHVASPESRSGSAPYTRLCAGTRIGVGRACTPQSCRFKRCDAG